MEETELLWNENLWSKLIKKSFWLYLFMILTAPIAYLIKVIASNQLSVEDFWIFYSILWLIWLISVYNDLWLTEALQYYLPKYWIEKKYNNYKTIIYITFFIQIISWVIIGLLLYSWASWLAINHFHSENAIIVIKLFSLYFLLINFLQAFGSFYTSFQDTLSSSLVDAIRISAILTFTIIFRLNNTLNTVTFSLSWIIWLILAISVSVIIFIKKYSYTLKLWKLEISKSLMKTQFKYAFWVFLAANVWTLFGQVNQQVVINALWAKAAWYYANFLSLITVYVIITSPVLSLLFPIVTELITKNDNHKLEMLQNIMYKYFSVFALSISWIFMVFGKELAAILFGVKFIYSWTLLIYAAPFLILNILFSINYWISAWLGKVKERVAILFRWLLTNIVLCVPLVYFLKLWIIWVMIAVLSWWFVLWILSFNLIHKHQKITFDRKYLFWNIITIWLISLILYYFKDQFFIMNNDYRYHNMLYFWIAVIIYYAILAVVNYKSIVTLMKEVKNIIGKK